MSVLVTGAAGFIGFHLSSALRARGHDVIGVDAFTDYYDPALKQANATDLGSLGVDVVPIDVLDLTADWLDRFEVREVVHLAGQPGVRSSWGRDFAAYSRANIDATQHLLELSKDAGIRRVVYASSSSVYGQPRVFPTDEQTVPVPFSPYGVTKLAGEHLARLYRENYGLETVSFRFFTVYGPRQRPDMAFQRFITAALRSEPIHVNGTGEQIRDFTYVEDVVDAIVLAVHSSTAIPDVMNLSGGSSTSVNAVLDHLSDVVGSRLTIVRHPMPHGDVHQTGGDSRLARESLGWIPSTPLFDGLQRQLSWLE